MHHVHWEDDDDVLVDVGEECWVGVGMYVSRGQGGHERAPLPLPKWRRYVEKSFESRM